MNTHTLVRGIDEFLPCVSEKSYLFSWLQMMRAWSTDMAVAVGKTIDGKDGAAVQQYLRTVLGEVRAIKARALFLSVEETAEALLRLDGSLAGGEDGAAARARRLLTRFSDSYEAFLESPSPRTVYTLVLSADMLRNALVTVAGTLAAVKSCLAGGAPGADDDGDERRELSIHMPSPVEFHDFTEKLLALRDGYEAVGRLIRQGDAPAPLRIGKIESGSMWIRVSGQSDAIALLSRAVVATARWIYRNHEGGPKLPEPSADQALELLGLESALRHAGVETGNLRDVISRLSMDLARCAATLVRGQPEMTVDGEHLSAADGSRERFLGAALDIASDGSSDVAPGAGGGATRAGPVKDLPRRDA